MAGTKKESEAKGKIQKLPGHELNNIGKVIAVMSGKGGVGKSSIAALLAVDLSRRGKSVGVLDADITGPTIPKMFGIKERPDTTEHGIYAVHSKNGIRVMSLNLLLDDEDDPVIWRGPLIAGAVRQFWTDVIWGDLDYLIIDLPPGTGDSPLTVMQQVPLYGLVIVSSPQEVAVMVVKKAVKMAKMMDIPILGLVENMSYVQCGNCGEKIELFGPSQAEKVCAETGIPLLGVLPINPELAKLADEGRIEDYQGEMPKLETK